MQWNPAQLLSLLHLSSIPSSQPNVLPPTHLYKKDERALPGDLHSRKLSSYPPLLTVVSDTTTHFLFSLSLFGFKALQYIIRVVLDLSVSLNPLQACALLRDLWRNFIQFYFRELVKQNIRQKTQSSFSDRDVNALF
jgi:hypothetical protein